MKQVISKFTTNFHRLLPKSPTTIAEYVWIGGSGLDLRGKTMCLPYKCNQVSDFPLWNFDGSSTGQATTENSEVVLKPVNIFPDPFRMIGGQDNAYLVLCETYLADQKTPAKANFRHYAAKVFAETEHEVPWFGWEQEYVLIAYEGAHLRWPLGFPKSGYASPQGQYYCSVGSTNAMGRYVAEAHMYACLTAGLKLSGVNAEVFPGQWEFQVGPSVGLAGCDELWVARYILQRVCEEFGVEVTFEPKLVKGDWNGSGCHTNMSIESTRKEGGLERIHEAMKELEKKHKEHILVYGAKNEERLTGLHETASIEKFSSAIGSRGTSVRIPNKTNRDKKGYFEDRRPAGNCDPYLVGGMLMDTVALKGKYGGEILNAYQQFLRKK